MRTWYVTSKMRDGTFTAMSRVESADIEGDAFREIKPGENLAGVPYDQLYTGAIVDEEKLDEAHLRRSS